MNLRQFIKYILWRDTTHHGEFKAVWKLLPTGAPRVIVDVGANDGFYGSNSFPFIARGWRAILIEPHPEPFALLQKQFQKNPQVTCLNLACAERAGERPLYLGRDPSLSTLRGDAALPVPGSNHDKFISVPTKTLAEVLASRQVPFNFGVLSVDVEGMDYEVLLGLDCATWRPAVIITEDFAPKETAKADYLEKNGYRLKSRIAGNTIWTSGVVS